MSNSPILSATLLQENHHLSHGKRQRWLATLSSDCIPEALAFSRHADWRIREQAILIIHRHAPHAERNATDALITRLHEDTTATIRVRSAFALAHIAPIGDVPTCDALIMSLQDRDGDVRYRAVYALSRIGRGEDALQKRCFDNIVACKDDNIWYVRHATLKALSTLNAQRAQPYLGAACDDSMRRVRETAKFLLV